MLTNRKTVGARFPVSSNPKSIIIAKGINHLLYMFFRKQNKAPNAMHKKYEVYPTWLVNPGKYVLRLACQTSETWADLENNGIIIVLYTVGNA